MLEVYREALKLASEKKRGVLVTVVGAEGSVPRRVGAKMLVREDGSICGTVGGGDVEHAVIRKASELTKSISPVLLYFDLTGNEVSRTATGGRLDVFFEPVSSPDSLYIFGAGHISKALAAMGKMLGFQVTVIDPRSELNNRERFPDADTLLTCDFCDGFSALNIGENDFVVITTPSHQLDEDCLHLALGSRAKYIGMVGSKRKLDTIREHLTEKGVSPEKLDSVHSPIGLDIGAETPEEIAVSIMAEIVAFRRGIVNMKGRS